MSLPNESLQVTADQLSPKQDVDTALQNLSTEDEPIEDGADKIKLKQSKNVPDKTGDSDQTDDKQDDKKARRTSEQKEIDELEEELIGDDDEKLDEPEEDEQELAEKANNAFVTAPRRKEILAKYPDLFKDFPYLQDAYYRDQQMKNFFASPAEAEQAVETLQQFDSFRQDLLQGNLESVFKTVKEADPNAFARIVDNVLVAIGKQDQTAYYHLLGEQTRATVQAMLQSAQQANDENLRTAAGYLWNFVFRGQPFDGSQRNFAKQQQEPQQDQLTQERQQFYAERLNTYQADISNKVSTHLRSMIDTNIDRNNQMPKWVKTKAAEDVFNQVSTQLQNDKEYRGQLDKYWQRAVQSNFSQQSLDAIRNYVITRGRQVLPQILVKTRNAAIQGIGQQRKPRDNSPVTSGRPAASSNSGNKVDATKLKTMDVREAFDTVLGD